MKEKKTLGNKQILTIVIIVLLVIGSSWVWHKYEEDMIESNIKDGYEKTIEENELLIREVDSLQKEIKYIKKEK